ncbi:hypothetical protein BD560DRAFT_332600 [Blakeslea trispora]|nr:hypothetical protein BD560DRAFT_332600 [Blakeslea trispora]
MPEEYVSTLFTVSIGHFSDTVDSFPERKGFCFVTDDASIHAPSTSSPFIVKRDYIPTYLLE